MLFGEYRFRGILEDEALLPPFKGSTFRGVFGRALKDVTCVLKRQECPDCLLRRRCIYVEAFEFLPELHSAGRPPPHPFVIEPPLDTRRHLSAGEKFDLTLLLFGKVNHYLPYFVHAFEQMGRMGVGRHLEGRRARFRLLSVTTPAAAGAYNAEDRTLTPARPVPLTLEAFSADGPPCHSHRQNQAMLLGGMIRRVTYSGPLTEFVPLLKFGEKVTWARPPPSAWGRSRSANKSP